MIWGGTSSGKFSVKSAYDLICEESDFQDYSWMKNWSLKIPPKLKIFLWTFVSSKLLTNVQRFRRRLTGDSSCHYCKGVPESMLHLFRDCPKAKVVWNSFNIPSNMLTTFNLGWDSWISANLLQRNCHFNNMSWNIFFVFCCWFIWKWRCRRAFDGNFQFPFRPADVICDYAAGWFKAVSKPGVSVSNHVERLAWIKPAHGRFKLNVDGSRSRNGNIGAGGVIRDHSGSWSGGFMINIGTGEVLQAEAWGLFYGLQLALSMQISNLDVELDSAVLVNLLQNHNMDLHPLGTIVLNCRSMLQQFNSAQVSHVHRERNSVADLLAKNSTSNTHGICYLHAPPAFTTEAILDDIVGTARCRSVRDSDVS
ncbi:hypothetical protein ACLB2K_068845 [Fragaria x ananassa]